MINLSDFYLPLRSNKRGKSNSSREGKEVIEKEINDIERTYDFDDPSSIDWDLIIVSLILITNVYFRKD